MMCFTSLESYFSFGVILLLHDFQDSVQHLDPQALHHICSQVFYGSPYLGWTRRGAFGRDKLVKHKEAPE